MEGLPPLDDSLFVEAEKVKIDIHAVPYNAKVFENQWFLTSPKPDNIERANEFHKYRADCHYLKKNYDEALVEYQILADLELSASVRRDTLDGLCRCLLKLGKLAEANEAATKMVSMAVNDDHLLQALRTLAAIQRCAEDYTSMLDSYQRCVHIAPACATLWLELADVYEQHLIREISGRSDQAERFKNERLFCLLNARQLSKTPHMVPSFYRAINKARLRQLDVTIAAFGLEDQLQEELNKVSVQMNFSTTNQEIDEPRVARLRFQSVTTSRSSSQIRAADDVSTLFERRWFAEHESALAESND